jgi:hypothetical protein
VRGLLRSIAFHSWFAKVSLLAFVSITLPIANITNTSIANAAPNPIEIISITESSSTSVEILFNSNLPKKQLSYYVINAAIELPVAAPQSSKTQNVSAIAPKNIKKIIKTKATGLITAEMKNLNPKAAYNFSISAKTNKGKMISTAPVEYSPLSNLMDLLSNLPADWGNPKPIQLPTPTPTSTPIAAPAFTLSSSSETRTVNTAATGFTINSTGGAIASFAISATPPGMSFNTSTGALTGTPNTVAGATAYTITATNASGSATQTFTLTVAIVAPAFTISSASETKASGSAITGYTISLTGGAIASYAISPAAPAGLTFSTSTGLLSGTPTTVAAATAYTITATNASGSATQTFTLTVTAAVYTVGQTGPGGGKIFYVAATPFACGPTMSSSCTYLEAAPSGWNVGSDPTRTWAQSSPVNYQSTTVNNASSPETATASVIGSGYRNTRAIILQGNNNPDSSAAALADAYSPNIGGVVIDDWFLPSLRELNEMCKWVRNQLGTSEATDCNNSGAINTGPGASGFGTATNYSSSTEAASFSRYNSNIGVGGLSGEGKRFSMYVRPVRAF